MNNMNNNETQTSSYKSILKTKIHTRSTSFTGLPQTQKTLPQKTLPYNYILKMSPAKKPIDY